MPYQVIGEGEPLVLVHGLSASSYWWIRNVPVLAQHYRVYLVDLPGFGALRHQRRRFVLAQMAAWLWQWMQAVGLERAHFIGHSMGGAICMQLAAERPAVVVRLVLVAPAVLSEKHSIFGYVLPLLLGIRYMTPRFLPILAYDAIRMGPFTLVRAVHSIIVHDMREKMKTIAAPTLLIWGEHDTLVPSALGSVLAQQLADARLLILPRAGHVCMFDEAQAFNVQVSAFLYAEQA